MEIGEGWTFIIVIVALALWGYRLTRRRDKWGLNVGTTSCPNCGMELPRVRRPASLKQAMWGGSTCPSCGTEVNKWGKQVG